MLMKRQHTFLCPQCGNRTVADSIGVVSETRWFYMDDEDPNSEIGFNEYYEVVRCVSCREVLIYGYGESDEGEELVQGNLLYPLRRNIPQGVPVSIVREFREAQKVEKISSPAYAVLIGRVLERLFKDQGAAGDTLYDQIKDLSAKNVIPETLCDMGHTLRFLRNKGAHAGEYEIEDDEVEAMRDFVITMLEYVYVAPAKLAALKKSIEKKKNGHTERGPEEK